MATRILAVSTVLLAALLVHQYSRTAVLRAQLADVQAHAVDRARADLVESLNGRGAEFQRTMAWLDAYYRSPAGLQRSQGLWIDGHPDFEAIGVWIFDVYLRRRLSGDSEDDARVAVQKAIEESDEWRGKHRR